MIQFEASAAELGEYHSLLFGGEFGWKDVETKSLNAMKEVETDWLEIVHFEAPIAEMVYYQSPNATEDVKNEINSDGECRK